MAERQSFNQMWNYSAFTAGGFAPVPDALYEFGIKIGMNSGELLLILCMLRYKRSSADVFPSIETLTRISGQSESTVKRSLRDLKAKGLIRVEKKRDKDGKYDYNVYDLGPLRVAINAAYLADTTT